MIRITVPGALCLVFATSASAAAGNNSGLVVVLPLDVTHAHISAADKVVLEESIRSKVGDVLTPAGFRVLTGDNTLEILEENGVDVAKACEASCALKAARELKAKYFVSGTVATSEHRHLAFVRFFESASGTQLASIRLAGRSVRDLCDDFEEKAHALLKSLVPGETGSLRVTTSPTKGVHLDLTTPSGDHIFKEVPYTNRKAQPGTWAVHAEASGYEDATGTVVVTIDEDASLPLVLNKLGALHIIGSPAGASVHLTGPNGIAQEGAIPWSATALKSGSYQVSVSNNSYRTLTKDLTIEPGRTLEVNIVLEKLPTVGPLDITTVPTTGVQLELTDPNGVTTSAQAPYSTRSAALGVWTVTARARGYLDLSERVEVSITDSAQLTLVLKPFGRLTVSGTTGASVSISGPAGFLQSGRIPMNLDAVPPGNYRVEASLEGYQSTAQTVQVVSGQVSTTLVNLVSATTKKAKKMKKYAIVQPPAEQSVSAPPPSVIKAEKKVKKSPIVQGDVRRDPATGLEWQRVRRVSGIPWQQAVRYCSSLQLNGTGWRLPLKQELEAVMPSVSSWRSWNEPEEPAAFCDWTMTRSTGGLFWCTTSDASSYNRSPNDQQGARCVRGPERFPSTFAPTMP